MGGGSDDGAVGGELATPAKGVGAESSLAPCVVSPSASIVVAGQTGDVPAILKMWEQATYVGEVCTSIYQPWHFPWSDQLNIEVQKCLTGQITADQCCDNRIKGIADAKRKT